MHAFLASSFISQSKYALVFILAIIEGPLVMISSGFLLKVGQFQFIPLYFALVGGDFVADIGWYFVGRHAARPFFNKVMHFFGITEATVTKIEERFHKHHSRILFISKITMGFGFALATLIVAGMVKIPLKKYAILNLLGGFIWTAILIAVGYFIANLFNNIIGPLKIVFLAVLGLMIIAGLPLLSRYLSTKEI